MTSAPWDLGNAVGTRTQVRFICWAMLIQALLPSCFAQNVDEIRKAVVKVFSHTEGQKRTGTGFIVNVEPETIYILTANHVVAGDKQPTVEFFTDRAVKVQATNVRAEDSLDFALLLVRGRNQIPPAVAALDFGLSQSLKAGDELQVIGFPSQGSEWALTKSLYSGSEGLTFRVAGSIDEGSSGSPLVKDGKVVGLLTSAGKTFGDVVPAEILRFWLTNRGITTASTSTSPVVGKKLKGARERAALPWSSLKRQVSNVTLDTNNRLIVSHRSEGASIWNATSLQPMGDSLGKVTAIATSPDGSVVAIATRDQISLLSAVTMTPIGSPMNYSDGAPIQTMALSADNQLLVTGSWTYGQYDLGSVRIWNLSEYRQLGVPVWENEGVAHVAIAPNGKLVVARGRSRFLRFWDVSQRKMLASPISKYGGGGISFSPDGRLVAVGSFEAPEIALFDASTLQQVGAPLQQDTDVILNVAFSPDGRYLTSASRDDRVVLWEVANRLPIGQPLHGQKDALIKALFSRDGKTMLSAELERVVLWDLLYE